MFAEVQTAHHGSGGNQADNPESAGSHLGQPRMCPCHSRFEGQSRKGDDSARQSGNGQDGTKQLDGFLIHLPILSCFGPNQQAHHGGDAPH
ncbi:unannotated protein [freshwater metagenome]|uniref:Unannotated protein n=1 Tax=freshwater metagenome TaxID=449393 RepID=A0A6J6VNW9_9ZZZZ